MNKNLYLVLGLVLFTILYIINILNIDDIKIVVGADSKSAFFGPVLMWCFGFIASGIILFMSNQSVFNKWFKKIFMWYVPLGFILTFTTDVYGGIPQPNRGDVAAQLSGLLVFITLIYTLVQKFYFKIK